MPGRGYRKSPDTRGARRVEDLAGVRRLPVSTFRGPLQAKQFAPDANVEPGGTRVPGGVLNYDDNIAAHPTLDARRAVPNLAIKDKAVDGRTVLHALNDNYGEPNRGIGFRHLEDHAANRRVIAGPFQNNLAAADPQRGIEYYHQVTNSTNTRIVASIDHDETTTGAALLSANTNLDGDRAIGGPSIKTLTIKHYHQADKSTDDRVLSSHANALAEDQDAARAAGAGHLKNKAAIKRVIGDEALSEGRQYRLRNRPGWMAGDPLVKVRGLPGDTDPNPVLILRDNVPANLIDSAGLAGHATDDLLRAVESSHQKTNSTTRRVIASDADWLQEANRAVDWDHVRKFAIRSVHGPAGDTQNSHVQPDAIGRQELMSHSTDDGRRGVGPDHIRDETMDRRHFRTRSIAGTSGLKSLPENVKVDGEEVRGRLNTNAYLQTDNFSINGVVQEGLIPGATLKNLEVTEAKLGAASVTNTKIANLAVDTPQLVGVSVTTPKLAADAITEPKLAPAIKNGTQATHSARTIGSALGGTSLAAAAGDHSHGSGNTQDFDFLAAPQRRRALAQRLSTRRSVQRADGPITRREFKTLQSLVLTLSHILMDAPDLDGFEREHRRRKGNLPFNEMMFEWRRHGQLGNRGGYIHQPHLRHYANPHPDLVA